MNHKLHITTELCLSKHVKKVLFESKCFMMNSKQFQTFKRTRNGRLNFEKNVPFGLLSYGKSKGLLGIPILVPLARQRYDDVSNRHIIYIWTVSSQPLFSTLLNQIIFVYVSFIHSKLYFCPVQPGRNRMYVPKLKNSQSQFAVRNGKKQFLTSYRSEE